MQIVCVFSPSEAVRSHGHPAVVIERACSRTIVLNHELLTKTSSLVTRVSGFCVFSEYHLSPVSGAFSWTWQCPAITFIGKMAEWSEALESGR